MSAPGAEVLLAQQDFVRSLVRSLLGHDGDTDDVVQATWMRALRHPLPTLTGVRPWLARIARNLVLNRKRDERRRIAREQAAARAEALPSTFEVLAREAERKRVVTAVLALPEPYRSVVLARYWEDVSAAHIAARLGVPDATVRSQLRRGLAMLRERLDDDGGRWRTALAPLLIPLVGGSLVSSKTVPAFAAVLVLMLGIATWALPWPGGDDARALDVLDPVHHQPVALVKPEPKNPADVAADPARVAISEVAGAEVIIDVRVREDGVPLANVDVELLEYAGAGENGTPERRALRTDMNGRAVTRVPVSDELRTFKLAMDQPRRRLWSDPVVVVPEEREVDVEATTMHFDCMLRGVVRDANDTPIAGATLSFNGWGETRSDADGRYSMPIATGTRSRPVLAFAPGFRETLKSLELPAGTREHTCDLVLLPGATITGRVVDGRGALVAGATVKASGAFRHSKSDTDGRFVLESLEPDSRHQVRAESVDGGVCAVYAQAGDELELVLVESVRIGGRVQDEFGRPIAGAIVSLIGAQGRTWTDRQGRFTVGGALVDTLAYQGTKGELFVRRKGRTSAYVDLDLTTDLSDLTVTLGPGRKIRGRVVDDAGAPIIGAQVTAHRVREVSRRATGSGAHSDEAGCFELHSIAPEPVTVHAVKSGFATAKVEVGTVVEADIELRMSAGTAIAGRVVDAATGEPVRDFSVRLRARPPAVPTVHQSVRFISDEGLWRHSRGDMVAGQEFDVRVTAEGYGASSGIAVAAPDASPDLCVLRLQPAVKLVGEVRDTATGALLAGVELQVESADEIGRGATITDANGRFALTDVGAGRTSLRVRAHGYPPLVHGPFDVGVGPGTQRVDVGVTAGVTLHGRLDGFGDLTEVVLQIDVADNYITATIAPDGTFAIPGLGRGPRMIYLSVTSKPRDWRAYRVIVPEHGSEPIVLQARTGDASLAVVVDGAIEGDISVTLLDTREGAVRLLRRTLGYTGGTCRFDGLAPGRYRVHVNGDGKRGTTEVDVIGDADARVVVTK